MWGLHDERRCAREGERTDLPGWLIEAIE
jgi:hypothetical protein